MQSYRAKCIALCLTGNIDSERSTIMPIQNWNHDAEPSPEKYHLITDPVDADWIKETVPAFAYKVGTPIQLKEGRTIGGAYIPTNALGEIVEVIHAGYVVAFHIEGKRIAFTANVDEIKGVHRG